MIGRIWSNALGVFKAVKLHPDGTSSILDVTLFPLRVEHRVADWPERGQRIVLWFELEGAARVVREKDLAWLIKRFRPLASASGVTYA